MQYLTTAAKRSEISDEAFLKIITLAINNAEFMNVSRWHADHCAVVVQEVSSYVKQQKLAFDFLVDQVKLAKFERIRLAAARGLSRFETLTDKQIATLRALRLETKEQSIINVLEKTLIRFESPIPL